MTYDPESGVFQFIGRPRAKYKTNKTGHAGVYQQNSTGRWIAHVRSGGSTVYKKSFPLLRQAVEARERACGDLTRASAVASAKNGQGYIVIQVAGASYRAHRLAWLYVHGEWPQEEIDHINHDRTDNRISNLRPATRLINAKNLSRSARCSSGLTGVHWYAKTKKWQAQIMANRKRIHLGYFDSFFDAAACRKSHELMLGFHQNHGGLP